MAIEKSITNNIIDMINSKPCAIAEKIKGDSTSSGRADINVCYKSKTIRIEVKTPDNRNKASKKQEHNLKKWFYAGATVMVVYSEKSVVQFLHAIECGIPGRYTYQEDNGCLSWMEIPDIQLKMG